MSFRVLIYCDDPDGGGTAVCTHQLGLGLAARNYSVSFAQTRGDAARIDERIKAGIEHFFIPYHTMKHYYLAVQDRQTPAEIFRLSSPDLVLFADSTPESTLAAKEVAAGLGIPFLIVKHMVLPNNPATQADWVRARINRACASAQQVILVSEASKVLLCQDFGVDPNHTLVIPNSRPAIFFQPCSPKNNAMLRQEWSIPPSAFVVMTVGSITKLKGAGILEQVVKHLSDKKLIDDIVFVWVGEGDITYVEEWKSRLKTSGLARFVRFVGRRQDVHQCLDAANAFLLPSFSESCPLVLIEAMAKSVPIIATSVGGIPETVGSCAALVINPLLDEARTAEEIAEVIKIWRQNPSQAYEIGASGAQRARRLFKEEDFFKKFSEVINKAAFHQNDYVSPGLKLIKLDRRFPSLITLDERVRTAGTRLGLPHRRYADGRDLHRLIPNRDEAIILHNLALNFSGCDALQVGVDLGWTSCHIAAAGVRLDIVDSKIGDKVVQDTLRYSLQGFLPVHLWVGHGETAIREIAERRGKKWSFILFYMDISMGNLSAIVTECERQAEADSMLVFWNLLPFQTGDLFRALSRRGWSIKLYDTAQMIGIASRGSVIPATHHPDPNVQWARPVDLQDF